MSIGCCLQQTRNVISQRQDVQYSLPKMVCLFQTIFFLTKFFTSLPQISTVKKRAPIMLEWKKQECKLNTLSLTNIGSAFCFPYGEPTPSFSMFTFLTLSHFHSRIFSHPDKNCDSKNKHNYKHGMPKLNIGTCIMKYRQYYANKYQYQ